MELENVDYIEYSKENSDKGYWGNMKRVALAQNGDVVKYHHPNDTDKWEDGTEVNWTEYENNGWNCMVEIPKVYYRVSKGDYNGKKDVRRWEISTEPVEGFKLHPSFNRPNHKTDVNYYGAFRGWVDSQMRLRSLPNKVSTGSKSLAQFRMYARNNGAVGYTQQDFYMRSLIQLLFITEYGTLDSQSVLGAGDGYLGTGSSLKDGNNTAVETEEEGYTSYRGIENLYSVYNEFVDGVNVYDGDWHICGDYSKYTGTANTVGYEYFATAPEESGIVRDVHYIEGDKDFGFIPSAVGEGGFVDYYDYGSEHRIVASGSFSAHAQTNAGAFYWDANYAVKDSHTNTGARLQFIGKK